jgi:hypothetical protein
MKKLYQKIAPLMGKIGTIGFVISLLGMAAALVARKFLTEPWPVFYASLTQLICMYGLWVFGALTVVFRFRSLLAACWEIIRKGIVALKRNPSLIPLLMLLASFMVYSLNLTHMSDTTALIQGKGMGLCQFCMMLFNMLAMLCMLNAFPRRKKVNIPMLALVFVMFAILVYCDIHYLNGITAALNREVSPIKLTKETEYIAHAFNMLVTYQTMLYVTAGLVVTLPIYSKLIRKIKTSVAVEDNGEMAQIEISEE